MKTTHTFFFFFLFSILQTIVCTLYSLINPITSCVKSAVRGSCSGVFAEDERKMIMNGVDLADYVCVDNLNGGFGLIHAGDG